METQISVEPLVYCLDQLRHPHFLFIADAITGGKEIYSMAEPELSRAEARGFLGRMRRLSPGSVTSMYGVG
jgi:hypothetical protein